MVLSPNSNRMMQGCQLSMPPAYFACGQGPLPHLAQNLLIAYVCHLWECLPGQYLTVATCKELSTDNSIGIFKKKKKNSIGGLGIQHQRYKIPGEKNRINITYCRFSNYKITLHVYINLIRVNFRQHHFHVLNFCKSTPFKSIHKNAQTLP